MIKTLTLLMIILLFFSCKKQDLATVKTSSNYTFSSKTAVLGGKVLSDGGCAIISKGICIGSEENPTILDTVYRDSTLKLEYKIELNNLKPSSTYFARAFVVNKIGTSYGELIRFSTLSEIKTDSVTKISSTSAISGGSIFSKGNATIISQGICWSLNPLPSISDSLIYDISNSTVFKSQMTSLTPGTTYYIRAFVVNDGGVSYGNEVTFTTKFTSLPSVVTNSIKSISYSTAVGGGEVLDDGVNNITSSGICWSTSINPTFGSSNSNYSLTITPGIGLFSINITNLQPNTTYYVRSFATNSQGISYGENKTFKTLILLYSPILTTTLVSSITSSGAVSGGNITSDGGSTVTARGVCWSTTANPSLASNTTINGLGIGSFSSSITGLTPKTTYYVRAYATNSVGTTYGNQITVSTLSLNTPSITTNSVLSITNTSASCGGNISSDGGAIVTARGVCWSTTSNPTLASNSTVNGLGVGSFSSSITGLSSNTTYYVRAYATNSSGTAYGNQVTFTTSISIGDSYGGGIVAYILQSGDPGYVVGQNHGLISASSDQSKGITWHNGTYTLLGASATAFGTGDANTNKIVSIQGTGSYAAKLCFDLVLGGYSDWYLPSKDELNKLYLNRSIIGGFNNNALIYYWSSSESSSLSVHVLPFSSGVFTSRIKGTSTILVRAIRSF